MRRWSRLLLLLVGLVALAGCQANASLRIKIDEDGGGTVTVAVDLDPEAASRTVLFEGNPLVADLQATGWSVTGPTAQPNGWYEMTATKTYSQPDQLTGVIAEVAGPDGPFKDFHLERTSPFGKRSYHLTGTVDLRGGLAAFSDPALTQALGGQPFGQDKAAIDAALGKPLESVVGIDVTAYLPGSLGEHNGDELKAPPHREAVTTTAAGGSAPSSTPGGSAAASSTPATTGPAPLPAADASGTTSVLWQPSFADQAPLQIDASSSSSRFAPRLWRWLGVAALIVGACALLYQLSLGLLERRRDHRRARRRRVYVPPIAEPEPEPMLEGVGAVSRADAVPVPAGGQPPAVTPMPRQPRGMRTRAAGTGDGVAAAPERSSGLRLLVLETAGVLFEVADPVSELLVPHVRARGSTASAAEIKDWYVARVVGGLPAAEFWAGLGILGDPMLLDDTYARRYELSPDILGFLHSAAERGLEVAALGDEVPEWTGVFRQRFGLDDVIGAWVSSGEVGVRPPHPALLESAWRATGFPARNAMVIARSGPLLDAARRQGARTVQYVPGEDGGSGDHPVLRSFTPVAS
jgi:hypothetical protein